MATKKKATPKKKPVQKKEEVTVQIQQTVPVKPPEHAVKPKHSLAKRLEALGAYVADMHGCTIEELHADPRFKDVPLPTLRRWADEDQWVAHRKDAYASLQKRLSAETGKLLTDQLYHEVQQLQKWDAVASKWLEDPETKPKSWEGVMKIKMEIQARLDAIASKVSEGLIDGMGKPVAQTAQKQIASGPKTNFSPEELKALAKLYTEREREKLRDKLRVTNPEMFEDEVINGEGSEQQPDGEQADDGDPAAEEVAGADPGAGADDIIPELATYGGGKK